MSSKKHPQLVFISYNSQDRKMSNRSVEVNELLKSETPSRKTLFIDLKKNDFTNNIWEEHIINKLSKVRVILYFLGEKGIGREQKNEMIRGKDSDCAKRLVYYRNLDNEIIADAKVLTGCNSTIVIPTNAKVEEASRIIVDNINNGWTTFLNEREKETVKTIRHKKQSTSQKEHIVAEVDPWDNGFTMLHLSDIGIINENSYKLLLKKIKEEKELIPQRAFDFIVFCGNSKISGENGSKSRFSITQNRLKEMAKEFLSNQENVIISLGEGDSKELWNKFYGLEITDDFLWREYRGINFLCINSVTDIENFEELLKQARDHLSRNVEISGNINIVVQHYGFDIFEKLQPNNTDYYTLSDLKLLLEWGANIIFQGETPVIQGNPIQHFYKEKANKKSIIIGCRTETSARHENFNSFNFVKITTTVKDKIKELNLEESSHWYCPINGVKIDIRPYTIRGNLIGEKTKILNESENNEDILRLLFTRAQQNRIETNLIKILDHNGSSSRLLVKTLIESEESNFSKGVKYLIENNHANKGKKIRAKCTIVDLLIAQQKKEESEKYFFQSLTNVFLKGLQKSFLPDFFEFYLNQRELDFIIESTIDFDKLSSELKQIASLIEIENKFNIKHYIIFDNFGKFYEQTNYLETLILLINRFLKNVTIIALYNKMDAVISKETDEYLEKNDFELHDLWMVQNEFMYSEEAIDKFATRCHTRCKENIKQRITSMTSRSMGLTKEFLALIRTSEYYKLNSVVQKSDPLKVSLDSLQTFKNRSKDKKEMSLLRKLILGKIEDVQINPNIADNFSKFCNELSTHVNSNWDKVINNEKLELQYDDFDEENNYLFQVLITTGLIERKESNLFYIAAPLLFI